MTSANKNVLRKQNEQAITNRLKIETFFNPESGKLFSELLNFFPVKSMVSSNTTQSR